MGVNTNERAGLSQTSKFVNGVQQSAQNADKLTDLSDLIPSSGLNGTQPIIQNSFKSQTLQYPNGFNSELGDDFINLFANWYKSIFLNIRFKC